MILITLVLLTVFILNIFLYWLLFLKVKNKERKILKIFYKVFPLILTLSIIPIPILNTSFLKIYFYNNYSYFEYYWIYFLLLGIAFIIIGINFAKRAQKLYKAKILNKNNTELITYGIFRLVRHPIYSAWAIIFLGVSIISDSLTSLITCVLIFVILEIHAIIEEKLILIPKFGKAYENYKKKTPNRIIPTPLNLLLIIITIIVVYVGFLNFN
ncbi:MAG: isoprenylcysteine carboxylmethyltransferase family protein [Promethearchaeota archaeon]|nr:MAG: isoprenylcysteine carboxylmethyltransferase family protein [Candidatus Lokiarchaeota archaeon]